MVAPYFSVGEEVILVSKTFPQYNGEYTIRKILCDDDRSFKCRISGHTITPRGEGTGYVLEEILEQVYEGVVIETSWAESSLRKKHKPAEGNESFKEMMSNLNKIKTEV